MPSSWNLSHNSLFSRWHSTFAKFSQLYFGFNRGAYGLFVDVVVVVDDVDEDDDDGDDDEFDVAGELLRLIDRSLFNRFLGDWFFNVAVVVVVYDV